MKKLSRLLLVLTLVLLIGCTSVLLVACDDKEDQGGTPTTPSFRVSFIKNYPNTDDDVAFTNVTVEQGKTVSAYEITEDDRLAGHDFDGWYVGKEKGAEKFDFATKITQNTKLYAHWKENGKSVNTDLSGNVFRAETVTVRLPDGEKEVETGVYRYVYGDNNVIPHDKTRFDFYEDVIAKMDKANKDQNNPDNKTYPTYSVWSNEECNYPLVNTVVNLKNGNNIYYIKAVAEDSKAFEVFKVNIYLEPKYNVTFEAIYGEPSYAVKKEYSAGAKISIDNISLPDTSGYTYEDKWYYRSEEKRSDGDIVDVNGDKLVKVDGKYYFADENGERMFVYVDENGRNVVYFKGKYYLTDKSGARKDEISKENIYNKLDENGYPVYAEGTPIKATAFTEYEWDFDKNIVDRDNIKIYRRGAANSYNITLTFDKKDRDNGAKFPNASDKESLGMEVTFGSTAWYVANSISKTIGKNPEKSHASFDGWYYKDDSGEEIQFVDGSGKGIRDFNIAKNITLVAKFKSHTYKIAVEPNNTDMVHEIAISNPDVPYDEAVTISATPKDGYKLTGWYLNGIKYDAFGAETSKTFFIKDIDESYIKTTRTLNFKAVFEAKKYNVTLESGVDSEEYSKTFEVKFNSAVELGKDAIPDVTKLSLDKTKRFIGWYVEEDGTKTYVVKYNYDKNENEVLVEKWTFPKDVTLTAEWVPYEFNVTIYEAESTILPNIDMGNISDNSGGSDWNGWTTAGPLNLNGYRTEGHQQKFANGTPLNFTAVTKKPKHYEFKGWYQLTADGELGKDPYSTEATLTINVEEKDTTYIAVWEYKQVTINFDRGTALENETTLPEQVKVDFNAPFTLPIPQGAPSEMTFDGWWHIDEGKGINYQYTGADGKNLNDRTFKDPRIFDDYNGTITLTAKWKKINYFIIENGVIVGIDEIKAKGKFKFEINYDDEVYAIKDGAFKNNWFIKEITIQGNIQAIGEDAFANSVIEKIVFEGSFKGLAIGAGAFRNTKITKIILPDNVTELGENVFEGCLLTELWYSAEIPLGMLFTTENPNDTSNWYPVRQNGVTYYLPNRLTTIHVTNTVSTIADYAFQNATQLKSVVLATKKANDDKPYTTGIGKFAFANDVRPNTVITVDLSAVERIDNSAFMNSSISTVDFSSLKELGNEAFFGSNVIKVVFNNNSGIDKISSDTFAKSELQEVQLNGIKSIGARAFAYSKLTSVSNADAVRSVGSKAFIDVAGITSAEIVEFANVIDIGREAFHGTGFFNTATGIVKIGKVLYYDKGATLSPDATIVAIAPGAFKDTQNTIIDLFGFTRLTTIGADAFNGNKKIQTVILPDSLERIEARAFKESYVKSVDFSKCTKLEYIAPEAFANCIKLETLTFNDFADGIKKDTNTLKIQEKAFRGCNALVNVTLPKNLSELGSSAFESCENLVSVTFITNEQLNENVEGSTTDLKYETDNLVKIIGDNAFMDCKKLTTVTLPYIITSIGKAAFKNCVELTAFTTMEGAKDTLLASIGSEAFFGCVKLSNVDNKTTAKVNNVGKSAFENCFALVNIDLSSLGIFSDSVFKNAINLESVKMPSSISVGKSAFENCGKLVNVTATINRADANAFINCVNIRSIVFASNIKEIGAHAFDGCVLIQKVVIPGSVVAIGDSAFNGCRNIITLTFEGSSLLSIGNSAFKDCELLTNVKLPASLTTLSASAFYGCSDLKNVEIGENIENIGVNAFSYCNDNITVKFVGTTVPVIGGNIFEGLNNAKLSVRQGYMATFEAVLGNQYTIVEYTA